MSEPELLTVPEVAAVLRSGKNFAYSLIASGAIPSVRLSGGRVIRVRRSTLEAWLQGQETGAPLTVVRGEPRVGRRSA